MKVEELNSCFESITPTPEQRERIFYGIMQAKEKPVRIIKFYRYASAVAAVFVIGVFAVLYPQLSKNTAPINMGSTPEVAMVTGEEQPEVFNEIATEESYTDEDNKVKVRKKNVAEMTEEVKEITPIYDEDGINANSEIMAAAAGMGGGGGSYEYDIADYESLTLSQVMEHAVYSSLVPEYFAKGYEFVCANAYEDGSMEMFFERADGKKMYITVIEEELYNPENVINPEEILNLEIKQSGFAVKCGGHYVYYDIDEGTGEDVYKMVTSSRYYN